METAAQRGLRLTSYQSPPEWVREAWHELPEAFDFRLAEEEMLDGNSRYVIETPRHVFRALRNIRRNDMITLTTPLGAHR